MRTDIPDPEIADGGPALFRLVRFWGRRWAAEAALDRADHVGHVQVLEAIDAAAARGSVTIACVAAELGLDRSNASRMLSAAAAAGYASRAVASGDARRAELGITAEGQALLAAARAWQRRVYSELVVDWRPTDARRFAGYLMRLADQLPATDRTGGPS